MSTPNLLQVNPKDVNLIWHEAKPLIDKALEHSNGELLSSDILKLIFEGRQALWIGINKKKLFCAGITEIITYPQKKVLRIITFSTKPGYHYDLWKDFIYILEDYGKHFKCSSIEAWARKGLARKLKWDHEYSVITKNI